MCLKTNVQGILEKMFTTYCENYKKKNVQKKENTVENQISKGEKHEEKNRNKNTRIEIERKRRATI